MFRWKHLRSVREHLIQEQRQHLHLLSYPMFRWKHLRSVREHLIQEQRQHLHLLSYPMFRVQLNLGVLWM